MAITDGEDLNPESSPIRHLKGFGAARGLDRIHGPSVKSASMNPVTGDPRQPSETGWGRFWRQSIAWVIADPRPEPPEIQKKLLHHNMRKKNTLVVVHLSMAVMATIAIVITGRAWAYVWLLAEIALGAIRFSIHVNFEKAEASGKEGDAIAPMIAGLVWTGVLAAAAYQCVASGEWLLILLAGSSLAGVIGGISSRNAGTPRYGIILICTLALPYAVATLISPIPYLYIMGLQIPFYVIAVIVVLFENHKTLLDLYRAERENRWLAHHDLLTGLPNRVMERKRFDELLGEPHAVSTTEHPPCTVFCLDLDGFKEVNDRFGHATGDAVLVAVAGRLRDSIRDVDFLYRIGGDEFVILLPAISAAEAAGVARRIIERVSEPVEIDGAPLCIGVSVGSACAPHDGETADELLRSADRAMYEAKRRGKGVFVAHGTPKAEIVELAPAVDANARISGRFPDNRVAETSHFPLPSRSKSL
jgi:diguanylate cyclase (GGDEF)-like protein